MPIDVLGVLLTCDSKFNPNYSSGFYLRGLFYKLIRSVDPGLALRLHDYRGLAPFSVSTLMKVYPGLYIFRVTSYLNRLSDTILKSLGRLRDLELMGRRFHLSEISFKRLDLKNLSENVAPYRKYELEFLSPTCFRRPCPYIPLQALGFLARIMRFMDRPRSHYRYLPLPDPLLMLRNLKRQWEQYAGMTIKAKRFTRWLEEGGVVVSGVDGLKTHRLVERRRGRFAVGFTGRVRLSLPKDTFREEEARIVNLLLRVGEETQVGVNRTAGFGMYKIVRTI